MSIFSAIEMFFCWAPINYCQDVQAFAKYFSHIKLRLYHWLHFAPDWVAESYCSSLLGILLLIWSIFQVICSLDVDLLIAAHIYDLFSDSNWNDQYE